MTFELQWKTMALKLINKIELWKALNETFKEREREKKATNRIVPLMCTISSYIMSFPVFWHAWLNGIQKFNLVSNYKHIRTFWSARALMTLPSARSERLMFAPSLSRAPRFLVTVALSEPARSTRHILATFTSADRPAVLSRCLTNTCTCKTTEELNPVYFKKLKVMKGMLTHLTPRRFVSIQFNSI